MPIQRPTPAAPAAPRLLEHRVVALPQRAAQVLLARLQRQLPQLQGCGHLLLRARGALQLLSCSHPRNGTNTGAAVGRHGLPVPKFCGKSTVEMPPEKPGGWVFDRIRDKLFCLPVQNHRSLENWRNECRLGSFHAKNTHL